MTEEELDMIIFQSHGKEEKALLQLRAERDALKQKLVEEDLIPIRVSVHGMYDCHLFHRYSGGSPKELANAWIEHNRKPHLRRHQEDGPAHEMGPTCLGPAVVLGSKREFRRVGKMVYARGEYPDVTYDTADLAAWVRALEDDPDITRLLRARVSDEWRTDLSTMRESAKQ